MNQRRKQKFRRLIGVLAGLLLCVVPGLSQQRLAFEHITTSQGLSQNTVTCIFQDSRGFMWFGTKEGLNLYDGFSFDVFTSQPGDANSLSNNIITAVAEDEQGYMWIGTNDGANRLDPVTKKFTRFYPFEDPTPNANSITCILVDTTVGSRRDEIVVWVGGFNKGLCRLSLGPGGVRYERFRHSPNDSRTLGGDDINSLFLDKRERLWIGTNNNTLNLYIPSPSSFARYLIDSNFALYCGIKALYTDSRNRTWAAIVNRGVYHVSIDQPGDDLSSVNVDFIPVQTKMPAGSVIQFPNSIAEDIDGNIWVGYLFYGVDKFEDEGNGLFRISHFGHENTRRTSLSSDQVYTIFIDRSNILWVGDEGYGINKARLRERFALYQFDPADPTSLLSKSIRGIFEKPDGRLLVGGYSDLMTLDRSGGVTPTRYVNNDPGAPRSSTITYAYCMAADPVSPDSFTWLGLERFGLARLNNYTNAFDKFMPTGDASTSLLNEYVVSLWPDDNGILWIGTQRGLQSLDVTNLRSPRFTTYTHDPDEPGSLGRGVAWSIYKTRTGIVWVGTDEGISAMLPSTPGKFLHFNHEPSDPSSLTSKIVKSIREGRDGTMWFGTAGGGLNKLLPDGRSFRHYMEKDGLPNNTVYGILEDSSGNLWLSTNKGISRFDPRTEEFWNFSVSDGLQDNEFNTGSYYQCRHGEMFFGGINGFNAFFPERFTRDRHVPPVHITSVKLFNSEIPRERIPVDGWLTLSHDEDVLSFEFVALDYSAPERNRYAYRMEGIDTGWIESGDRRYVSYAHVAPGRYRFLVKGSNSDGVWNEHPATFSFVITPPFWATWWFRTLVIIALISIGPYFYYRRVRQLKNTHRLQQQFSKQLLEKQENERKRIAAELHDSIGQNMLVMKNKSALGKETQDAAKKEKYFEDISEIVLKTLKELQEISYNLRPYELDRIGLTEAILAMFSTVKDVAGFHVRTSIENIDGLFAKDSEIHLYRIIQEGMNNILKHSHATEAVITIKRKERSVLFLMQDNGVGVDLEDSRRVSGRQQGFGLSGVKERVTLIGGTIEFHSEVGVGTTLRIELPMYEGRT